MHGVEYSVDQQHARRIAARVGIALDKLRKRAARVDTEQVLVLEAGVERAGGSSWSCSASRRYNWTIHATGTLGAKPNRSEWVLMTVFGS